MDTSPADCFSDLACWYLQRFCLCDNHPNVIEQVNRQCVLGLATTHSLRGMATVGSVMCPTEVINRDTYDAFRHGDKTEATADKKTDTDVTKAKIDYKEGTEHFESKEWVKGT